jgi:hypothetical protein
VEIMKEKEIEKIKRQLALPSEEELAKLVSLLLNLLARILHALDVVIILC